MPLKTLFIGHYRDGFSGWATGAQQYMKALDAVGVEVIARSIKLNNSAPQVCKEVLHFEKRKSNGARFVIQNVLPHWMERIGGIPNFGLCYFESQSLNLSNWPNRLLLMDKVITANSAGDRMLKTMGMKSTQIPVPQDFTNIDNVGPLEIPPLKDKFIFYFVGEFSKRKNIAGIIRAFNTAFYNTDNVGLVLKLNKYGKSPEELKKEAENFISSIKAGMKLPRYQKEYLVVDELSDEQIISLHKSCHCLVMPSFGEGWNLPTMTALAVGNAVLSAQDNGIEDFPGVFPCSSDFDSCFGEADNFPFLFTGADTWTVPNIYDLSAGMRQILLAHQNGAKFQDHQKQARSSFIRQYLSYEKIGKELLACITQS